MAVPCKRSVARFFLVLLLAVSIGERAEPEMRRDSDQTRMRVYFIPFEIQTYSAVTMNDIEAKSLYALWFTKEHSLISKFRRLLQSRPSPEKIDNMVIRLKVELPTLVFYVDQEGRVLERNRGDTFQLSKKQMAELKSSIVYFDGVIDIRASKDVKQANH